MSKFKVGDSIYSHHYSCYGEIVAIGSPHNSSSCVIYRPDRGGWSANTHDPGLLEMHPNLRDRESLWYVKSDQMELCVRDVDDGYEVDA